MNTEDVLPVYVSVQALALAVISGETFLGVRDVKSSIDSSLEGSENLCSSGGPGETHIQTGTEGTGCAVLVLHAVHGDVSVGASDNQPVLGGVVFVLVLDDQTLAGVVV